MVLKTTTETRDTVTGQRSFMRSQDHDLTGLGGPHRHWNVERVLANKSLNQIGCTNFQHSLCLVPRERTSSPGEEISGLLANSLSFSLPFTFWTLVVPVFKLMRHNFKDMSRRLKTQDTAASFGTNLRTSGEHSCYQDLISIAGKEFTFHRI